jgi:hypothetical protein
LAVPGANAGVVVLRVWSSTKVTVTAAPPIVIDVGSAKFVPWMVVSVPPSAGPDGGFIEKMIPWESSEVSPPGSVAVAVIRAPASVGTGSVMSKSAWPEALVVAWPSPRYPWACRSSLGKRAQAGFE